jgi:hypothetical protein
MNDAAKMLAGAIPVLGLGLLLMQWQTSELARRQPAPAETAPAARPAPTKAPSLLTTAPPPAEPALTHTTLLSTVEQAMLSRMDAKGLDELQELAEAILTVRVAAIVELSEEEWKAAGDSVRTRREAMLMAAEAADPAARGKLLAQAEAEYTARLTALLGPERSARWMAAESARRQAVAEFAANKALHSVSRVIPLDAARRDALYDVLHTRAIAEPLDVPVAPYVMHFADVREIPDPPDLSADLEAVLTEEQQETWRMNRNAANFLFNSLVKITMENLLPAIKAVVIETLDGPGRR